MTDFLTAVDSDSGKKEPIPVTVTRSLDGWPNICDAKGLR